MDIKSLLDKFTKKSDDSMITSDPFEGNIQEPASKISSFFSFLRRKRNKDDTQEDFVTDSPTREAESDKGKSHLVTNITLLCILAVVIGAGVYIFHGSKDKEQTASTFQSATGKPGKKDIADKPENPNEVKVAYGNVMINPFVDLGEMRKNAKLEEAAAKRTSAPPLPVPVRSYEEDSSLPAIPSFTPPSPPINAARRVGEIPAPLGGRQSDGSVPAQSASVEVQGVLMGNDGSSMAILSDGSVVETGDTYRDGRIAYIGGDGIKFDDGSSMQFKE